MVHLVACPRASCSAAPTRSLACVYLESSISNVECPGRMFFAYWSAFLYCSHGCSHTKDEVGLACVVHSEAILSCFMDMLYKFLVPSGDEDFVDIETKDCKGAVATVR